MLKLDMSLCLCVYRLLHGGDSEGRSMVVPFSYGINYPKTTSMPDRAV